MVRTSEIFDVVLIDRLRADGFKSTAPLCCVDSLAVVTQRYEATASEMYGLWKRDNV